MTWVTINRAVAHSFVAALLFLTVVPEQAWANGTATLKVTANTTLTADFAGNVVIAKDGVTLDCAGHQIIGNGKGRGITVEERSGVTVKNCDVSNFATGFWVASTSGSTFEDNASHDNQLPGSGSVGWTIGAGFWLQSSSGNTLLSNSAYDNPSDGFDAFNSSRNVFTNNSASGNGLAGWFFGNGSINNTLDANSADLNGAPGFIIADGASDNTLVGNTAQNNGAEGFIIDGNMHPANGNSLVNNRATGNRTGFRVIQDAANNVLISNFADGSAASGFVVALGASDNNLDGNVASGNTLRGFSVSLDARGNILEHNSATGNGTGCDECGGFILIESSMNTLVRNSAYENVGYGFGLFGATSNTLTESSACTNSIFDAFQDAASTGNVWTENSFCTSSGI